MYSIYALRKYQEIPLFGLTKFNDKVSILKNGGFGCRVSVA